MHIGARSTRRVMILLLGILCQPLAAQQPRRLLDLRGSWKFELGDDMKRAAASFNDREWSSVEVPSAWEDQGFPGYDGFAWYRKHFSCPADWRDKDLLLQLGRIDDADEVYVNGQFIGFSGSFPPEYITSYAVQRQYVLPFSVLKPGGDNVIAVRVYDDELSGGILDGPVGIVERRTELRPDVPLQGEWKFRTGDDSAWKERGIDESGWRPIRVPGFWETQGARGYDGFAWYRLHFRTPGGLPDRDLVLLLGKIDDADETYLNGQRIGRTGTLPRKGEHPNYGDEYTRLRAYVLPPGALNPAGDNVLAVRVYDSYLHGGIYDGPIGFVTRERYLEYRDENPSTNEWGEKFWRILFGP